MQYVDQVKIVIIEFWIIAFYIIQKFHALIFKVLSRTFIFENIHCLRHLILFFHVISKLKLELFFQVFTILWFVQATVWVKAVPVNVSLLKHFMFPLLSFYNLEMFPSTFRELCVTHTQSIFRFTNSQHFSSSQIIVVNLLAAISTIICSQNSFHIKSCHHYHYIIFPINVQNSIFLMLFSLFQLICTCFTIVCLYILLQDVL